MILFPFELRTIIFKIHVKLEIGGEVVVINEYKICDTLILLSIANAIEVVEK